MTVTAHSLSNYQVQIKARRHTFISDEPLGVGDDAGPEPYDLLLSSIASCTIITLHMYARRKNWPLERVEMTLDLTEPEPPADGEKKKTVILTRLTFHGDLTEEQLRRLEYISTRCPVHKTLHGIIEIRTEVSNLEVS